MVTVGDCSEMVEAKTAPHCSPRVIAFFLPQFHPIAENDRWWGKGFTEWTNVVKARPLFPGHYQPHLPADLGFYDLRLLETRQAQADLARRHGIAGFCYYHYWFHGRRVLHRPVDETMVLGQPRFPFCLCWANESWTRAWDGGAHDVLIEQTYSQEDDRNHIRFLASIFADERYIRMAGKPLFLVYRASRLPDPLRTTDVWRDEMHRLGLGDLFLCRVESFVEECGDPHRLGFDAAVEFQPRWFNLGVPLRRGTLWRALQRLGLGQPAWQCHRIFHYGQFVQRMMSASPAAYRRFPCVTPGWDNTPRRQTGGLILAGSTPQLYEGWLRAVLETHHSTPEPVLFINAWNEWAEGNHLEPCQKWGLAYLEATSRALATARTSIVESTAA